MKNSVLLIISLLILSLTLPSCEKEDNVLPAITMEGKNTFGCLINEKVFISKGRLGSSGCRVELQSVPDTVGINIYAGNDKTGQIFIISLYDTPTIREGKKYEFSNAQFYLQYTELNNSSLCSYEKIINGYVEISSFDLELGVVSGIFNFKAYSNQCKDTVRITDGRFNIELNVTY